MFKNRLTFLFAFLVYACSYGQQLAYGDQTTMYSQMGREGVFIHYNSSLLFVGEYLYYSMYCLNRKTKSTSTISKIAYVELVGENGKLVFRQKVRLNEGYGQGDFFIPVSVPSGNYKLLGYTQWMVNWGERSFFQDDISILNPYTNLQKPLLPDQDSETVAESTPPNGLEEGQYPKFNIARGRDPIALSLSKDTMSRREKASLLLQGRNGESSFGHYSISVRRYDDLYKPKRINSTVFKERLHKDSWSVQVGENILPEMRGSLFSGTISTDKPGLPVENQKVLFSMPGQDYELKVLTTNGDGEFSFSLGDQNTGDMGLFQVLGHERESYKVALQKKTDPDYSSLAFKKFRLSPLMEKAIVERSVHNQIENAYFSTKPDTVATLKKNLPFYGNDAIVYHLDDYTRFPTIKETFVEIVSNIWITKDKSGKPSLAIGEKNSPLYNIGYKPLVIIDGKVLQDFEKLIEFDAGKIRAIRLKKGLYTIGGYVFQGILDVETFENDFQFALAPYVKEENMLQPLVNKKYFKQVYTKENRFRLKNIPDYRYQLLWLPKIKLDSMAKTVDFFTSDVPGNYEISLEGFTFSGQPVSLKKRFVVK